MKAFQVAADILFSFVCFCSFRGQGSHPKDRSVARDGAQMKQKTSGWETISVHSSKREENTGRRAGGRQEECTRFFSQRL
eukprot:8603856-Heterocapsa_arctica.AAC.1